MAGLAVLLAPHATATGNHSHHSLRASTSATAAPDQFLPVALLIFIRSSSRAIARKTIELRNNDLAAISFRSSKSGSKLRPNLKSVTALASLYLDIARNNREPMLIREPQNRLTLRVKTKPRSILLLAGDTVVRN